MSLSYASTEGCVWMRKTSITATARQVTRAATVRRKWTSAHLTPARMELPALTISEASPARCGPSWGGGEGIGEYWCRRASDWELVYHGRLSHVRERCHTPVQDPVTLQMSWRRGNMPSSGLGHPFPMVSNTCSKTSPLGNQMLSPPHLGHLL